MKNQCKSKNENKGKNNPRTREGGHQGTSGEIEKMVKSKVREWPEEKELLDKCDGLATAAGIKSEHDGITIQYTKKVYSNYMHSKAA